MSKSELRILNDVTDDEDIEPSDLIDTQENKPRITQQEDLSVTDDTPKEKTYRRIEHKPVGKLTQEESQYLIDLYKNGGEDDYYKVYFYKNGTNKIVKKKQPPKYNTAKRLLEQQQQQAKPVMTTEQVLMEHVIDLEAKFATLYQKHKKLKKNYKSLQEDIYFDDEADGNISMPPKNTQPEPVTPVTPEEPTEPSEPVNKAIDEREQEREPNIIQHSYINRLRRPQRGYRSMMANLC